MKPDKDKQPKSAASKKPNGRVFDVSRPGKAAAPPTSKPVISGHRPEAQAAQAAVSGIGEARPLLTRRKIEISPLGDLKKPEVEPTPTEEPKAPAAEESHTTQPTEEEAEALGAGALDAIAGPPDLAEEPKDTPIKSTKITITPPEPSEPEQPTEPEKPAESEKTAEPEEKPEAAEAEPAAEETPEAPKEAKPEEASTEATEAEQTKPEPELADKELPAETSSMPEIEPVEKAEGEEAAANEPVIEPLFDDSGSIVVSNHEHHHRHHGLKVFLLLLLILVLAAAILNFTLDLGLLDINGLPHTNFLN